LRFPRQGQFHPQKYLLGLAEAIERRGGQIFCGTHVAKVMSDFTAVETDTGAIVTADDIVVATNTPINDLVTMHTKQAPYMTYVIGLRVLGDAIPRALFWDTGEPYHYVRTQTSADGDILIVGGEDHKTGQAHDGAERYVRLEAFAHRHFPGLGEVRFRWSGQVMEPIDGVAFIGRNPGDEHVYIVTGDSGMGMTHGTIAGLVIRDQILGRENAWAELYNPARKTVRAAVTFAQENLNVVAQFGDYFSSSAIRSPDELAPGEAAVERHGLHRVAVYRDPEGTLHELSAVCPHLGCIVHWNSDDRTWDCPCHGSRFTCDGKVISGPANVDLAEVKHEVHH
jgi:Rieske Fe-S protein